MSRTLARYQVTSSCVNAVMLFAECPIYLLDLFLLDTTFCLWTVGHRCNYLSTPLYSSSSLLPPLSVWT
jgi:hypothetical protein